MLEHKVVLVNKLGMHLRAANELVKTACGFNSDIRIRKGPMEVDAKSILGLLGLEAPLGTEVSLIVEGPDEEDAMRAVKGLFEAKFNEEE
jgi:phosphotransferase system HPr (HPr) family protein